jgi:2,3-bisphosphoglycerate-independent phosphoglycerate mutase
VRIVVRLKDIAGRAVGLMLLVTLAVGSFTLRRRFIQTWFRDASAQPAPRLTQPDPMQGPAERAIPGLGPDGDRASAVKRTRVVVLDGLDAARAARLPTLSRFCASGIELAIDVGFPTVSLPVEASLWTGLTQQQLGLWYRTKALPHAPPGAAPARVPGSVAVAEDQPFIAGSLGFSAVTPPVVPTAGTASDVWNEDGFVRAAIDAVAGPASLAFIHVLRIDKAGHKAGAASPIYAQAARWSDQLLGRLLVAAPAEADTRWFVLADHGHRPLGGHGGGLPNVRLVRGCLAGGGIRAAGEGGRIHLVDLSRALFDSLGLSPPSGAVGRPLRFALAHPDHDAIVSAAGGLPGRPWLALALVALFLIALVVLVAPMTARRRIQPGDARSRPGMLAAIRDAGALAWLPLAYAAMSVATGPATLSNPIIYPPWGRDIVTAGAPGLLLLLLIVLADLRARWASLRVCALALLPPLIAALGALIACGGLGAVADPNHNPPLRELATGQASVLLTLLAAAAGAIALVWLLALVRAVWLQVRPRSA